MELKVFDKFVGEEVMIEMEPCKYGVGTIMEYDDFGIYFMPSDAGCSPMLVAWHNINKIILKPDDFVVIESL
ncbi:MAG: hypothetical protein U9R21_08330 [Candidatus Thermoplasmatota archaeon]|nr:hypothetical protein [Candidatus Thermoplasmatota archaeon]